MRDARDRLSAAASQSELHLVRSRGHLEPVELLVEFDLDLARELTLVKAPGVTSKLTLIGKSDEENAADAWLQHDKRQPLQLVTGIRVPIH